MWLAPVQIVALLLRARLSKPLPPELSFPNQDVVKIYQNHVLLVRLHHHPRLPHRNLSRWPVCFHGIIPRAVRVLRLIVCNRVKELVSTQPVEEGSPQWVCDSITAFRQDEPDLAQQMWQFAIAGKNSALTGYHYSIKKPKTSRYPSLKGTDPKFRRNHKHALHGTMKALVRHSMLPLPSVDYHGYADILCRRRRPRASATPHRLCFEFPAQGHEIRRASMASSGTFSDMFRGGL